MFDFLLFNTVKPNMGKSFSLVFFFFPRYFPGSTRVSYFSKMTLMNQYGSNNLEKQVSLDRHSQNWKFGDIDSLLNY